MIKITVFDKTKSSNELIAVDISHLSMFDDNKLSLHFLFKEQQLKFISLLIVEHVVFDCIGQIINLNLKERQKINMRFDSIQNM